MDFIANVANGKYFMNLVANLARFDISEVLCAVAYAQRKMEIFDYCHQNSIKLKFWGRYDHTVPVSTMILESFINRSSDLYRCYLVKELFHPKVYWFRGYGAYIGSANIGDKAWFNNVEAGLFLTEDDLLQTGMGNELENFFAYLSKPSVSTMLNSDILKEIKQQEARYSEERKQLDAKAQDRVSLIPDFRPEILTEKKSSERRKDEFLKEWNATLNIIREVAAEVIKDENRPSWIPKDIPAGVQVDQFLHSFYYARTRATEGRNKYLYEEHFEKNKGSVKNALLREMSWWKSTKTGPVGEESFIKDRSPRLKELLSKEKVARLTETEFIELCSLFHAFNNVSRYFPPRDLGLSGKDATLEIKKPLAARLVYNSIASNGLKVPEILYFVLYGGPTEQVVHRLYEAWNNKEYRIPRFGRSCYGELVGWALPEHYPPRNDRTNKALRGLGYDVVVWNPSATDGE
ncbi:MAG TPA: phospholipase D-like domain-containing protein [Oligoflexus sp.]|uniref:phospholipase D-like domain-containing protein n=1 Tax=Oligoflexus sp. TaxID=1971216 RepID=UPI002D802E3D|nr:phospholipase D-like domain-containing protein [Oligoflexus sp.]HET9239174.1 phospholipase D-like domain-containing protein [Oligoflexus sp.]